MLKVSVLLHEGWVRMVLDSESKWHELAYVSNPHLPYPNRDNTL